MRGVRPVAVVVGPVWRIGTGRSRIEKSGSPLPREVPFMTTTPSQGPLETIPARSVEQRFRELEAAWLADTYVLSSGTRIIGHPAFRAIVGLGEAVVPFMLADLEKR